MPVQTQGPSARIAVDLATIEVLPNRRAVEIDTLPLARRLDLPVAPGVTLLGLAPWPETVAPGQPVECYGPAASAFTERELEGYRVRLEFDVERIDRYGRTLAYVWRGDELFNETLVREVMEGVASLRVPLKVDVGFGRNWAEAH